MELSSQNNIRMGFLIGSVVAILELSSKIVSRKVRFPGILPCSESFNMKG